MYGPDAHIVFPEESRRIMLEHCHGVLDDYQKGCAQGCKAFGLVFGDVSGTTITVARCFPLMKNVRSQSPYKEQIDKIMEEHAIPSVTPLEHRGWVADPAELFARIRECRADQHILLGTYHMHRVGWEHDRKRDTPTKLDAVLASESRLLMFIVSMVDPAKPIIRVFYEGIHEQEVPIQ
jgi:hypothetical protein